MTKFETKRTLALALAIILLGTGVFVFVFLAPEEEPLPFVEEIIEAPAVIVETGPVHKVIGASVEGRDIDAYTYGDGETHLLFVGGIHGGYEWNSVLLADEFIDYLNENPDFVPSDIKISVIPSANPDGIYAVLGVEGRFTLADALAVTKDQSVGRFNANGIDLNRNFDCKWASESSWRGKTVSAGSEAFSEPEAQALRDFVAESKPNAVIFWHSQSDTVYGSECEDGIIPETLDIMNAYATAAGYGAVAKFDAYPITGDAEGWLASVGIPAITVELTTHETVEWNQNLKGVEALLQYYTADAMAR